jgi:GNAT superfamily N-acetyltransferase
MISYRDDVRPELARALELYRASTLAERRPVDDHARFAGMLENANLIITAWDGELLVGISRCITDFSWTTYLADFAVRVSHQRSGIGKELIRRTQAAATEAKLLLLAAPAAEKYYAHIGFQHFPQAWMLRVVDVCVEVRAIAENMASSIQSRFVIPAGNAGIQLPRMAR